MKNELLYEEVDTTSWKRHAHFNFFKSFEKPLWGVTIQLNCTKAFAFCKASDISFFSYYLYQSLRAANEIMAFRMRIDGEKVLEYKRIDGSITVLRTDETFGFAYFDFHNAYAPFQEELKKQIIGEKQSVGLKTDLDRTNVIHYSILPYFSFTQMEHAQYSQRDDCIPKITFGKYFTQNQQLLLPMSVHVHHALCDGLDVGKFMNTMQGYMEI